MTRFAGAILVAILFSHFSAFASDPIGEFHQVSDGIFRGARPSLEGLQYLQQLGVKTILDLENDDAQIKWEKTEAAKLGMTVISTPMSGFWRPKNAQVKKSLQVMEDSQNYPVFVHCQHGQDRTGLIVGLFRVLYEKWTPQSAHDEMIEDHFHPLLFLLDEYFAEKTGYIANSESDTGA